MARTQNMKSASSVRITPSLNTSCHFVPGSIGEYMEITLKPQEELPHIVNMAKHLNKSNLTIKQ